MGKENWELVEAGKVHERKTEKREKKRKRKEQVCN